MPETGRTVLSSRQNQPAIRTDPLRSDTTGVFHRRTEGLPGSWVPHPRHTWPGLVRQIGPLPDQEPLAVRVKRERCHGGRHRRADLRIAEPLRPCRQVRTESGNQIGVGCGFGLLHAPRQPEQTRPDLAVLTQSLPPVQHQSSGGVLGLAPSVLRLHPVLLGREFGGGLRLSEGVGLPPLPNDRRQANHRRQE